MNALLNGTPLDHALAGSRGLHYGDGVFRTLLVHAGEIRDEARQWAKLSEDARRLDLDAPATGLLAAEARALFRDDETLVLKAMLIRSAAGRGYAPAMRACDRLLLRYPAPAYPASHWQHGVEIARSAVTLAAQPLLAGIKHLNRLEQVLASRGWAAGIQEAILCDDSAAPICGTRSNLFWVSQGQIMTPPVDRSGVAGVMRQRVIELAATLGLPLRIERRPWSELMQAEEIFLSNSLIGIWLVSAIDGRPLAAPGALTRRLMDALAHPRLIAQ